ncbi:hypothetical protein CBS101457_005586 [Exobasidium rhododendri]|nr:hypothetical protein CBS101457_005586 [Exobasidium rhododendri]
MARNKEQQEARARAREAQIAAQRGIDNTTAAIQDDMAGLDGLHFGKLLAPQTVRMHQRCLSLLRSFFTASGSDPAVYLAPDLPADTRHPPGSLSPISTMQWQRFAKWFASVRVGSVRSRGAQADLGVADPLKLSTVLSLIRQTMSAVVRHPRSAEISKETRRLVFAYIESALATELSLITASRPKPVGMPVDFEAILSAVYSEALPFRSAEERLAFTGTLKMLAYTVSRPGELIHSPGWEGDQQDGLRWCDIELFYVTCKGGECTLAARVCNRLLKGKRLDDSSFKSTIVRLDKERPLLCPILDLLGLAEIQGMLETSAADILRCCSSVSKQPPGTTLPIRLKAEGLRCFVFRRFARSQSDILVSNMPATQQWFGNLLELAGLGAGIVNRHTAYVWRRMSGNILNCQGVTAEDRKLMMGHNLSSKVFGAYISRTAQVDLQGLVKGSEEERSIIQATERLSRVYSLPKTLSVAGRAAISAREDVEELTQQRNAARDSYKAKNPNATLKQGIIDCDADALEYLQLQSDCNSLVQRLAKNAYQQELEKCVAENDREQWQGVVDRLFEGATKEGIVREEDSASDSAIDPIATLDEADALLAERAMPSLTAQETMQDDVDAIMDVAEHLEAMDSEADDDNDGDDANLESNAYLADTSGSSHTSIDSMTTSASTSWSGNSTSSNLFEQCNLFEQGVGNEQCDAVVASEGIPSNLFEQDDAVARVSNKGKARAASRDSTATSATQQTSDWQQLPSVQQASRRNEMVRTLLGTAEAPLSPCELMLRIIDSKMLLGKPFRESVGHSHPPGGCGLCSATDISPRRVVSHRQNCELERHAEDWMARSQLVKNMQELTACPCPTTTKRSNCGKVDASDIFVMAKHLHFHTRMQKLIGGRLVFLGKCWFASCDYTCDNAGEMRIHYQQEHQLLPGLQSAKNMKHLVMQCSKYCDECRIFVTPQSAWRDHCSLHLQALSQEQIVDYSVVYDGKIVVQPGRCPICLHDETIVAEERAFTYRDNADLASHMQLHIIKLAKEEADSNQNEKPVLSCPIPSCVEECGSTRDFGNHFVDAHNIAVFGRSGHKNIALSHWDGNVTTLARYDKEAKITERRGAAKRARLEVEEGSDDDEHEDDGADVEE